MYLLTADEHVAVNEIGHYLVMKEHLLGGGILCKLQHRFPILLTVHLSDGRACVA